jgi:hypothetical protein
MPTTSVSSAIIDVGVPRGPQGPAGAAGYDYPTKAAAVAATIPGAQQSIRLAGVTTAGDSDSTWKKLGVAPGVAKSWHFQSADGAWWELARAANLGRVMRLLVPASQPAAYADLDAYRNAVDEHGLQVFDDAGGMHRTPIRGFNPNERFQVWTAAPESLSVETAGSGAGFGSMVLPEPWYMGPGEGGKLRFELVPDDAALGSWFGRVTWTVAPTAGEAHHNGAPRATFLEINNQVPPLFIGGQIWTLVLEARCNTGAMDVTPLGYISTGQRDWQASKPVAVGNLRRAFDAVNNITNVYEYIGAGTTGATPPTSTSAGFFDGSAIAKYIGPDKGIEFELWEGMSAAAETIRVAQGAPVADAKWALSGAWQTLVKYVYIPPLNTVNTTTYAATSAPSRTLAKRNAASGFLGFGLDFSALPPLNTQIDIRRFNAYPGIVVPPRLDLLPQRLAQELSANPREIIDAYVNKFTSINALNAARSLGRVTVSGGVVTIENSWNLTAIGVVGTGRYLVSLPAGVVPDHKYGIFVTAQGTATGTGEVICTYGTPSSASVVLQFRDKSGAFVEPPSFSFVIFEREPTP